MSTTLSTQAMVTMLNRKTGLGLTDGIDFINEAFRKLNQMSKGGFIWQLKLANLNIPALEGPIPLPTDFDPGKTAVLRGDGTITPTKTIIPYVPAKEWVNEQHFQATGSGFFASWTFYPTFTITAPTSYSYVMQLAPSTAFGIPVVLPFYYHALNFQPFAAAANVYFPTPDQFDNLIVDLAIAEVRNVYRMSGEEGEVQKALAAISDVIDTYRTDRMDLAGLTDQMAQSQEKQLEQMK